MYCDSEVLILKTYITVSPFHEYIDTPFVTHPCVHNSAKVKNCWLWLIIQTKKMHCKQRKLEDFKQRDFLKINRNQFSNRF